MIKEEATPVSRAFERHTQTALVLLLVALLLWVGNTTQQTAVTVAEMRVELAYLKAKVDEPQLEHMDCIHQLADLRERVTGLEGREHTIED
jgi:hypothetical protein